MLNIDATLVTATFNLGNAVTATLMSWSVVTKALNPPTLDMVALIDGVRTLDMLMLRQAILCLYDFDACTDNIHLGTIVVAKILVRKFCDNLALHHAHTNLLSVDL